MARTIVTRLLLIFVVLAIPVAADLWLRGTRRIPIDPVVFVAEGVPARGRQAIVSYGCGACHVIGGINQATGRVGPRLTGLREQIYLAGVVTNVPDNLIAWIQHPQQINPLTAMPDLQVSEADARDMAAYLYSQ